MATFALVHGSMHGGWCWRDLVPRLERRGHRVVAPDLPCDDADAGLEAYADAVERALDAGDAERRRETREQKSDARSDVARAASAEGPLVLVGHSLGSRTIPVLAARRPGARMVFLCSVPTGAGPVDAEAFAGMVTPEYASAPVESRADGARRMEPAAARRLFFDACDEATARWAADSLRFQGGRPLAEAAPFAHWPAGRIDVVLTRDDRVVRFAWAKAQAERWLAGRAPVVLPGDHSPFLSCPDRLADALVATLAR